MELMNALTSLHYNDLFHGEVNAHNVMFLGGGIHGPNNTSKLFLVENRRVNNLYNDKQDYYKLLKQGINIDIKREDDPKKYYSPELLEYLVADTQSQLQMQIDL